jgi:AcrR family transcriptional regulator
LVKPVHSIDNDAGDRDDTASRILRAAATLVRTGGPEAATTRAVAAQAGVQAPTIYRLFGDKEGLLDAVAEDALASFVRAKSQRLPGPDPVAELRHGWDNYVEFALANPALFAIINRNAHSAAAVAGARVLRQRIDAIAAAGRLHVPAELAADMVHAAAVGVLMTVIASRDTSRGLELSRITREAIVSAVAGEALPTVHASVPSAAITLHARLGEATGLSQGERLLMEELLTRLSHTAP